MSDLKNTLAGLAKNITKTSKDVLATSKLSLKLMNEEAALKQIYQDIGHKVHELYAYGGTLGKFFDDKYLQILSAETTINDLKSQINTAKGVKVCKGCGKNVDRTADFCPKCGNNSFSPYGEVAFEPSSAPSDAMPSADLTESIPVIKPAKVCSLCGYDKNTEEDKFCLGCGRML